MPEEKIQTLYAAHHGALVRYAAGILGDSGRAEDVVQEAYIRFWSAAKDQLVEQPLAYLYRIVRNQAFDVVRRHRTERRADHAVEWWLLPEPARTPEEDMMHQQVLERVEATLAGMPMRERLAVEMKRFGGYTLQEIADRLDVSVATAHRLVRGGLLKVADAMDDGHD